MTELWWKEPFFQVALPIIITFIVTALLQNKRLDEISSKVGKIEDTLTKIEEALRAFAADIAVPGC